MTLENHVFLTFEPYSALVRHMLSLIDTERLVFGQTSLLRLETRLISSNCIMKLCSNTFDS